MRDGLQHRVDPSLRRQSPRKIKGADALASEAEALGDVDQETLAPGRSEQLNRARQASWEVPKRNREAGGIGQVSRHRTRQELTVVVGSSQLWRWVDADRHHQQQAAIPKRGDLRPNRLGVGLRLS